MVSREGMVSMSEADRAGVIEQLSEKRLRQREAAERLGLSVRQAKQLLMTGFFAEETTEA